MSSTFVEYCLLIDSIWSIGTNLSCEMERLGPPAMNSNDRDN